MVGTTFGNSPLTDPLTIYRYRDGQYAADLLTAAIAWLDLFSWIGKEPSTLEGVCAQFGTHPRPTDVMLTLFAAMRLLQVRDGIFDLTPTAREHLVCTSPWFIGPYFAALKDRPVCKGFVEVLRTDRVGSWAGLPGQDDWHRAMAGTGFAQRFTAAMDARGMYLSPALARSVDLSGRSRLLDIAGGSGVYACAFVDTNPDLQATVMERTPVDVVAAHAVADKGFSDRVAVHAADIFEHPWPVGFDVHLMSNVVHDWPTPIIEDLFARSFAVIEPGGMLIIHDAFLNAAKDGPLPVAEYSALLMHSTQGRCYSVPECEQMLTAAGFTDIDYQPTAADRGRMIARKPGANVR